MAINSVGVTGLTPFPYPMTPLNNITPMTYRDGITFASQLEHLRQWVEESVFPEFSEIIQKTYDNFLEGISNAENTITSGKAEWQTFFDAFMVNIDAELQALNDSAVASLAGTPGSALGVKLRELFANKNVEAYAQGVQLYAENVSARVDFVEDETRGLQVSANKTFKVKRHIKNDSMPDYFLTTLYNAQASKHSLRHIRANDSNEIVPSPVETISSVNRRIGSNVLINASGYWGTNRPMGLTIYNGVLLQDWEQTYDNWGVQSFVVFDDGHVEICKKTTESGAQIVARGGYNSFTWGKAALIDGVNQGLADDSYYASISARTCIGIDMDDNIVILSCPGKTGVYGLTIQNIYTVAVIERIKTLYMLDGGGSAQLMVDNEVLVASSDATPRPVIDYLAFSGVGMNSYSANSKPLPLILESGAVLSNPGEVNDVTLITRGGITEAVLRINLKGVVTGDTIARLPRAYTYPKFGSMFQAGSNSGVIVLCQIQSTGGITLLGPGHTADKAVKAEFRYIIENTNK